MEKSPIDIKNNKLVVNKYMIHNITSYDFINNALITLNKDKILKLKFIEKLLIKKT